MELFCIRGVGRVSEEMTEGNGTKGQRREIASDGHELRNWEE